MKKYITKAKNTCWRDCLACLLEIEPRRVPDFAKLYDDKYMDFTRDWLEKFGKGLVYIPTKNFMETDAMRDNPPMGPSGYSIGHLTMVDGEFNHVVICYNGGVLWDNGDDRHEEYGVMVGYFVLYDLEPKKAKKIKKH